MANSCIFVSYRFSQGGDRSPVPNLPESIGGVYTTPPVVIVKLESCQWDTFSA